MKKKEFMAQAGLMKISIGGRTIECDPKEFATGSIGWYFQGKITVTLPDGSTAMVQAQISLPIARSKERRPDEDISVGGTDAGPPKLAVV